MYILIILSFLSQIGGYTTTSIEFQNEGACKVALKRIQLYEGVKAICVQK